MCTDIVCSVCETVFKSGNTCIALSCGHCFHSACSLRKCEPYICPMLCSGLIKPRRTYLLFAPGENSTEESEKTNQYIANAHKKVLSTCQSLNDNFRREETDIQNDVLSLIKTVRGLNHWWKSLSDNNDNVLSRLKIQEMDAHYDMIESIICLNSGALKAKIEELKNDCKDNMDRFSKLN